MLTATHLFADCLLIQAPIFKDSRGFFQESYSLKYYQQLGINETFVQDNISQSAKGVVRGMHFQRVTAQGKLITVLQGSIYDVMLDIRPKSKTFGRWHAITLQAASGQQLYIPPGFAHGFQALSDNTIVSYKASDYYCPKDEASFNALDPELGIAWPQAISRRSAKDISAVLFKELAWHFSSPSASV